MQYYKTKDLNNLPLEELLGLLLTHEMGLNEEQEQTPKSGRRKGMALKSKVVEETKDKKKRTAMKR